MTVSPNCTAYELKRASWTPNYGPVIVSWVLIVQLQQNSIDEDQLAVKKLNQELEFMQRDGCLVLSLSLAICQPSKASVGDSPNPDRTKHWHKERHL